MRKVHTKRYNKQVPGHHIQMDVKFLMFEGKGGKMIKRYQYTAIDDATRVRALKVYARHTQANGRHSEKSYNQPANVSRQIDYITLWGEKHLAVGGELSVAGTDEIKRRDS